MPAPLDLASRRFGRLQVLERAEAGARPAWRCRCDCGGIEVLRQYQLTERGVDACKACRQPDCAVCGTRVPLARGAKNTCSPGCEKAKIAANSAKHNARAQAPHPCGPQQAGRAWFGCLLDTLRAIGANRSYRRRSESVL